MTSHKMYKDSIIYFIGSIIVAILGFVVSLLYSYFFTPNDYGIHSIASSTYMLLSQFCGLWLSTGILRFYEKYKNNNDIKHFCSSIYITQLIISILFVVFLNVGAYFISDNVMFKKIFFVYSFVYFFEYNILVYNTNLRCENDAKKYNFNVTLNNFLKILILLILFFVFRIHSVLIISISILLSEFFQFSYIFIKYRLYKYYSFHYYRYDIMKEVFIYAFPLIGTTITNWVLNVSDRYVINFLIGSYAVGLYSYAYLLGNNLFWLLSNFIMLGAYPNFVKAFEKKDLHKLSNIFTKYINLYLFIILPCCFGVVALSENLFLAITSSMYHNSYNVFMVTGIGISILGLCQFVNKIFELYKKTQTILILNIICAVVNILLNFVFVYCFGYLGGAISTMLSYLLYFVISLFLSKKYFEIKWDYKLITKYIFSSIIMFIMIIIVKHLVIFSNHVINFFLYFMVGIIIYFLSLFIIGGIDKNKINEIKKLIKN